MIAYKQDRMRRADLSHSGSDCGSDRGPAALSAGCSRLRWRGAEDSREGETAPPSFPRRRGPPTLVAVMTKEISPVFSCFPAQGF